MLKIEKRRLMNEGEELEVEALKQQLWNLQHGCEAQFSISEKNQRYYMSLNMNVLCVFPAFCKFFMMLKIQLTEIWR